MTVHPLITEENVNKVLEGQCRKYFQIPVRPLSVCYICGGRTNDSHWASLAIKAYYSFQTYS